MVQISDLHLGSARGGEERRWRIVADAVAHLAPDLLVASGDITDDAWKDPPLFRELRDRLDSLPCPWAAVPGNHDVGNKVSLAEDPATETALAEWRAALGANRFEWTAGSWRLIGIDSQVIGSGFADEAEQWAWLAERLAAARRDGRRVALFLHTPPYVGDPDEPGTPPAGYWNLDPEPRARLARLLAAAPVDVLANGHVHWYRSAVVNSRTWVWCPSLSAIVDDPLFPRGGDRFGMIVWHFEPGGASHYLHELPIDGPLLCLRQPRLPDGRGRAVAVRELLLELGPEEEAAFAELRPRLEALRSRTRIVVVGDAVTGTAGLERGPALAAENERAAYVAGLGHGVMAVGRSPSLLAAADVARALPGATETAGVARVGGLAEAIAALERSSTAET